MLHSLLVVVLTILITCLALALICVVLRPRTKDDVMQQAIGDAPAFEPGGYLLVRDGIGHEFTNLSDLKGALEKERFPRGGYDALDEQAPIEAKRPS